MLDNEVSEVTKLLRREMNRTILLLGIMIFIVIAYAWWDGWNNANSRQERTFIMLKKTSDLCKKECNEVGVSSFSWNDKGASCECMGIMFE